jgi:sodium/proline symporter
MGIRSGAAVPGATAIALVWVAVSLAGAIAVGLIGIPLFEGLSGGDEEKVFLLMIGTVLAPWVRGVMLAAVLSAIMSTIDSQLLVSSSTLTEDFYKKAIRPDASEREMMFIGRASVVIISVIALLLALRPAAPSWDSWPTRGRDSARHSGRWFSPRYFHPVQAGGRLWPGW